MQLDDLTAAAQEQVKQGIQAEDRPDAARRLADLTREDPANPNLKPLCPPSPSAGFGDPTPNGTPTPSPGVVLPSQPAPTPSITATTPANTPDAPPSDTVPPVNDPVGCRSTE